VLSSDCVAESKLGRKSFCFYGARVIGFLRFVGMLNAAVWLGAALFCLAGASPALASRDAQALFRDSSGVFREQYFDYLSGALAQVVSTHYFHWHIVCALIALLHLLAEWLYLGRSVHRAWLGLLAGLLAVGLISHAWMIPQLAQWHRTRHAVNAKPEQQTAAAKALASWQRGFLGLNLLMLGGVAVYFWRITMPTDPLRFVGPTQFRS
jgi:hypothetical protein